MMATYLLFIGSLCFHLHYEQNLQL